MIKWKRIDEGTELSFLTRRDKAKILDLAMNYAWNCWYLGEQMFDWEDAEQDDARDKLEDFLNSI
jgi:hypothetical protein